MDAAAFFGWWRSGSVAVAGDEQDMREVRSRTPLRAQI